MFIICSFSGIADDVKEVKEKFGYKYIQLEVVSELFYYALTKLISYSILEDRKQVCA